MACLGPERDFVNHYTFDLPLGIVTPAPLFLLLPCMPIHPLHPKKLFWAMLKALESNDAYPSICARMLLKVLLGIPALCMPVDDGCLPCIRTVAFVLCLP